MILRGLFTGMSYKNIEEKGDQSPFFLHKFRGNNYKIDFEVGDD